MTSCCFIFWLPQRHEGFPLLSLTSVAKHPSVQSDFGNQSYVQRLVQTVVGSTSTRGRKAKHPRYALLILIDELTSLRNDDGLNAACESVMELFPEKKFPKLEHLGDGSSNLRQSISRELSDNINTLLKTHSLRRLTKYFIGTHLSFKKYAALILRKISRLQTLPKYWRHSSTR